METIQTTQARPSVLSLLGRVLKAYWPVLAVLVYVSWRMFDGSPGAMAGKTPDFSLPEISPQGGPFMLSAMTGDVRIVDFWAPWCGPCKLMTPIYSDLYRKDRARGLEVVGVALDSPESVARFVNRYHVPYPVVIGDSRTEQEFGGIRGLPTTFILDREGRVVQMHVGYRPEFLLAHDVEPLLEAATAS